jgi:hypothetical protein
MRFGRSHLIAALLAGGSVLAGCSRHAFEPVPSSPEAILAFKLRTLIPGRTIRIQRIDGSLAEGKVVVAAPDHVVLAGEEGRDSIAAMAVGTIWQRRGNALASIAKTTLGAALGAAILLGFAYGAGELGDSNVGDGDIPVWYLAPRVVGTAAGAGTIFGAVIYASSPEWNPIYPIPAGSRP